MRIKKILFWAVGITVIFCAVGSLAADGKAWPELKGDHFIVYYSSANDAAWAREVLRKAEEYYRRIGERVGYTRYATFWTWNERVKILLFSDQESFLAQTGFPKWAKGYANRDSHLFQSRLIVTFRQEAEFFDGVLPHEISHLMMHDFIPEGYLPIWLDEGVAQMEESGKLKTAQTVVQSANQQSQLTPLGILNSWDIRTENDPQKVGLFYAESLAIVDFLYSQYGQEGFRKLFRDLRDKHTLNESLPRAYSNRIRSLEDLEKRWLESLK